MPHVTKKPIGFKAPRTITKRVTAPRFKQKIKPKFTSRTSSGSSSSNRRGRKKARNIIRSNPTKKSIQSTQQRSKIQEKRKVSIMPIPSGSGKFTRAIDVGRGKMQDAVFTFSKGKITNKRFLGEPVRQSKRFKEKRIR